MTDPSSIDPNPEVQGVSVVAIGSFNPAIYHPIWFETKNLISNEESKQAKVEINNHDIAIFSTEWFRLQATSTKLVLQTNDPSKRRPLRDLMVGTFKILEHTPINAFGFNCEGHYKVPSEKMWHAFGHYFAPKDSWSEIMDGPGLRILIIQGKRTGSESKYIQMRIEPSTKLKTGIFLNLNEHFEIESDLGQSEKNKYFLDKLTSEWDFFLNFYETSSTHLLKAPYLPQG